MDNLSASVSPSALAAATVADTAPPVAEAPAEPKRIPGRVFLDHPFDRDGVSIASIDLRKPQAGELRGLSMTALMQMDYAALETLLPRITAPRLTKDEIKALDPADLVQLAGEVMDFLLPKDAKPDFPNP